MTAQTVDTLAAKPGTGAFAQTVAAAHFRDLQARITAAFETLDPGHTFTCTPWTRPDTDRLKGDGEMRVMRGGVFEKVGVNFSNVWGTLSDAGMSQMPGAKESEGRFTACGISLVAHMTNPFVPIVHMNLRCMTTSKGWFGGGADLTPTFPFAEDTADFHAALKGACEAYRPDAYDEYKAWCDKYFYLPHRKEPRGVGGIFFDDLNSGDGDRDWAFVRAVGEAFLAIYPKIVARRMNLPYTDADRDKLLLKRGRYVEFNLVYDRGTRFGFVTEANPEAYLMSMPPIVKW
ncbi:MAG: oxygen-dependent coproporphyrinogen oxidase [Rhodospirillaceae bacterium]|nr:MAG: oxygen-dependent coproporphyrinogen oxidase [Rhodospirillaceae bacterium]